MYLFMESLQHLRDEQRNDRGSNAYQMRFQPILASAQAATLMYISIHWLHATSYQIYHLG